MKTLASFAPVAAAVAVLAFLPITACGGSSSNDDAVTDTDVAAEVPADAVEEAVADVPGDLPGELPADLPHEAASDAADLPADFPVDVAQETTDAIDYDYRPPLLTPAQIGYRSVTGPWLGSVIYFNTWSMDGVKPDDIRMVTPDGAARAIRLQADRVWTFGVAPDGRIAFASADPLKATNYPDLEYLGDAIQYTFLVRPGEDPVQVSNGRVNDECHAFLPDGRTLVMCRRGHLRRVGDDYLNDPYRVVKVDLDSGDETFLSPLVDLQHDLNPNWRQDGRLVFMRQWADTLDTALYTMDVDGGVPAMLLEGAFRPSISEDGKVMWFRKSGVTGWWKSPADQPGAGAVVELLQGNLVAGVTPSPDGSQVVYEVSDNPNNCTDLWVADAADGFQNPRQLVDCDAAHDHVFISNVRWVNSTVGDVPQPTPEAVEAADEPVAEATDEPAVEAAEIEDAAEPSPEVAPGT